MKKFLIGFVLIFMFSCGVHKHYVPMKKLENGLFTVPIKLGDEITCNFIIDTGCSETVIPSHIFHHLVITGVINKSDMETPKRYILADGSSVICDRVKIKKIIIGDVEINDIIICVSNSASPLLLGQNILNRFSHVQIDYTRLYIILNN